MERDLLPYDFFLFVKAQDRQLSFPVVGRENDVPLAIEYNVELHVPRFAVVSVFDFVREDYVTLHDGRQLSDVEALLLHCQVSRLRVVPDAQVSLALLKRVPYGPFSKILLAHARDASLWVS